MKTMIISEFKAKCISTLKAVETSGEPMVVTLRGRPIVEIEPLRRSSGRALGSQKGCMTIKGDIVHTDFADEWVMNEGTK